MLAKIFFAFFLFLVCPVFTHPAPFEKVLLVINYNFPHYESLAVIIRLYKDYFPNIVFYGPSPENGEVDNALVHKCEHTKGYLSYLALADAMQRYPDFDGYLFCMDDCIIHPWRFVHLDQTKIWFPIISFYKDHKGCFGDITKGINAFPGWPWWQTQWGCKQVEQAFFSMPTQYRQMLENNCGKNNIVIAYSDIMYIPRAYTEDFIILAHIYGTLNKSFLEVALPTITHCLSSRKDWCYLYGVGTDRSHVISSYRFDVDFIHPLKLSYPEYRNFITEAFAVRRRIS